jgi:hypothetical protein
VATALRRGGSGAEAKSVTREREINDIQMSQDLSGGGRRAQRDTAAPPPPPLLLLKLAEQRVAATRSCRTLEL